MELMKNRKYLAAIAAFMMACLPTRADDIDPEAIPHLQWKAPVTKSGALPSSVDNNKLKYFPPIISQIGGSCAQASTIGYMCTYELNRLLDRSASELSNRCSYLYSWNFINGGRDEGSLGWDGLSLAYNAGLMSDADFPRQTDSYQFKWASGYDKYYRALFNKVKNFNDIAINSEEGIETVKQYLYNKNEDGKAGGIVIFSSLAEGWRFNEDYTGPSETGITCLLTKLGSGGPHGMTITGYDDLVEFTSPDGVLQHGAFIVTNTHGTFRHDRGRFYLPYWFFLNEKDHLVLGNYVTGAELHHEQPQVVFRLQFEYSSRDDLTFRMGVSNSTTATVPMHEYLVPLMNNQGGDHPMQGSYADPNMDVAFDFTPFVNRLEGMEQPHFFLKVIRGKWGSVYGQGKLYSAAVYDYRKDPEHPKIYKVDLNGQVIAEGVNIISIPTEKIPETSYSRVNWLNTEGKPAAAPFIFKTADGKYVKVKFTDYDRENGTLHIRYVYNPNGDRKLAK